MPTPIVQYLKKIERVLTCLRATKKNLISNIRMELFEYAGEAGVGLTYDEICQKFGAPEYIAAILQDSVDKEEVIQVKRRRAFIKITSVAVLIIALLVSIYFYRVSLELDPSSSKIIIEESETITLD